MAIVIEILAPDDRVVATIALPGRELLWSDGAFTRGVAFAAYSAFFRDLETASKRFDAASGAEEVESLAALAELWTELNHLRIRERGAPGWLADVGLLLAGDRARIRYWAATNHDTLSDERLDELEALTAADDGQLVAAARTYMPRLIAEIRRSRAGA